MCRTANGADVNFIDIYKDTVEDILHDRPIKTKDKLSANQKDGRGNLCPVTIILPTLAMEANRDVEAFMSLLEKKISEAKDMLIERFNYICEQSPDSAKFMYENGTMLGYKPEEGIKSALKHGTLAIGQLGVAETLQLLVGCDQTTDTGMALAKRIEGLFKQRCAEFKREWHYLRAKPSDNDIKAKMIKIAEKNLGRKLTLEELSEIKSYKEGK